MVNVTRRFARVVANDRVSLTVRAGEVHALVGENGAGKSTLMKVLYGLYQPDDGTIRVDGKPVRFRSPAGAIAAGIGMVHQHFMLIPPFTVAENVVLGDEGARLGFVNPAACESRVGDLARRYGVDVDPRATVASLSVGQQQRVEILKILFRQARTIILDEPTAVLTPQEVDTLFETVRGLRAAGKTIIIITHKLREVMALSDCLTILRDGRNVANLETRETNPAEIARLMVGREVVLPVLAKEIEEITAPRAPAVQAEDAAPGEAAPASGEAAPESDPVLRVSDVNLRVGRGRLALAGVSLEVRAGEVLGIAGVEGNGQGELVDVLTGMRFPSSGRVEVGGRDVTRLAPREKFSAGIACIPEDRQRKGMILDFTLRENLLLGRHHDRKSARQLTGAGCRALLEEFDVRPANPALRASQLSGGNQQKVIVAREFTRGAPLLIASQPTRGIDLGAIEFIHRKLLELRASGVAILLVSAELGEVLALSDRVAVMYGGRIVFCAPNRGLTEHNLGVYMAGGRPSGADSVAGEAAR
jgi:simple sugar transport system ATP-binding protein